MTCKYRMKPAVKNDFKEVFIGLSVFSGIFSVFGLIGYILSIFGLGLVAGEGTQDFLVIKLLFYILNGVVCSLLLIIVLSIVGLILVKSYESVKGMFEVCPDYTKNQRDKK